MKCCICGKEIEDAFGWKEGHNPWPAKEEGRCCTKCNDLIVVPLRMKRINPQERKTNGRQA